MNLDLSPVVKTARLNALLSLCAGGTLTIYSGPRPAPGGAATTALLVYALASPAGTVAGDTLTFAVPAAVAAATAATAVWGRIADSGGNWLLDGDAGPPESAALFRFNDPLLIEGVMIALLAATLTEP